MITISAPAEYDYYQSRAYIAAELIDWVRFRYPEIIADEILRDGQIIFFGPNRHIAVRYTRAVSPGTKLQTAQHLNQPRVRVHICLIRPKRPVNEHT